MPSFWVQFILTEVLAVLDSLAAAGVIPPQIIRVLQAIDAALDQIPGIDPTTPVPPTKPLPPQEPVPPTQ